MAKFEFRLPSQNDIRSSANGNIMFNIIEGNYDEKYTLVTGCPGSGKTTVSILRLVRLANEKKPTVLLTYQQLLKTAIQNILSDKRISTSKVNTIHSWFPRVTGKLLGFSNQSDKLSTEEIESALNGRVNNFELILDEAQDLEERVMRALPKVFSKITIGADDDQQIYNTDGVKEDVIEQCIKDSYNGFSLQFNYRNTYQIYNFARYFVPKSLKAGNKETLSHLKKFKNNGALPSILKFNNLLEMQENIKTIIDDNEGFNVGILLPYQNQVDSFYDFITQQGYECSRYHNGRSKDELSDIKSILVTTFMSAKGLEFDIVIMPDFNSVQNTDDHRRQAYIGCTRASRRLYIMHTGNQPAILNGFPSETYDDGQDNDVFGTTSKAVFPQSSPEEDLPF